MNKPLSSSRCNSNKISLGLCYSAIDVVGQHEFESNFPNDESLKSFLEEDGIDIDALDIFLSRILEKYGKLTASGISQRIGMVFFHYLRRKYPGEVLHEDMDFKLKLFHERVNLDFTVFFHWLQEELGFISKISKQDKSWIIELNYHSLNHQDSYSAYFFKGILQELFEWLDCHYRYQISMAEIFQDAHHLIRYEVAYSPLE
jgi:hypothetical protein